MEKKSVFIREVTGRQTAGLAIHKLIATGLGIGYIRKGGGTVASVLCCVVWYMVQPGLDGPGLSQTGGYALVGPLLITVLITTIGIWSATVVEPQWGKDSYRGRY